MDSKYEGLEFNEVNQNGKDENEIILFALSTCGHCARAKKFLTESGHKFKYIYVDLMDFDEKQELKDYLREKFEKRVAFPFLVINDEKSVVGFLRPEYEKYV